MAEMTLPMIAEIFQRMRTMLREHSVPIGTALNEQITMVEAELLRPLDGVELAEMARAGAELIKSTVAARN